MINVGLPGRNEELLATVSLLLSFEEPFPGKDFFCYFYQNRI